MISYSESSLALSSYKSTAWAIGMQTYALIHCAWYTSVQNDLAYRSLCMSSHMLAYRFWKLRSFTTIATIVCDPFLSELLLSGSRFLSDHLDIFRVRFGELLELAFYCGTVAAVALQSITHNVKWRNLLLAEPFMQSISAIYCKLGSLKWNHRPSNAKKPHNVASSWTR